MEAWKIISKLSCYWGLSRGCSNDLLFPLTPNPKPRGYYDDLLLDSLLARAKSRERVGGGGEGGGAGV